jgi:tetratricopeptide (TPR) repeat protein
MWSGGSADLPQTMHYSIKTFFVATALLLTCAAGRAQSANALMEKGDVFDLKFQAGEALKYYLPAEKLEPANVSVLVRIARQYRHLMADATLREEKLRLGGLSLDYALRAAALAPNDSEAQLSPAITYGKMMPFEKARQQVETTPLIKAGADRAIQLDPRNDVAWYVLGRWHEVLADVSMVKRVLGQLLYGKLPTSTNEEAATCFNKAMEINPRQLRNYIELGRTYAQMGRTADARRFIEKGLAMPNMEHDDPEANARGRETLAKLP